MRKEKTTPIYITALLFITAAVSCLYGIKSGEAETVWQKAANMCMECIGID